MGHHISKSVSHGSISSRATKSTKNQKKPITTVCTIPTHSSAVIDNLDSTNQQQHLPFTDETTASESHANFRAGVFNFITDSPQNIRSQTKTIKSLGATRRITNEKSKVVGSQQIVIKIQLAKMESGEVNDDSVPDCGVTHSNNNLNVECSVLNLSFPQNIICESSSFAPDKKILMSSIVENHDLDSSTEIKLNNLNITEDSNTRLSINSESTISISKSVPFIDDDGNDLDDASRRVFAKGTSGQNFNITLQPVSKFEIPIHLPPGSCIVNRSGTRVEKLPKVEDKSMIEYSDVADINEKVIDEDSVGADGDDGLEDKSVSFKRKAKTSSTYPSLSKCGDAIKQFLNSSKSSKKQEKERKPPPTSTSLITSNSRSSQLSYASDNETDSFSDSSAAAMARETMVVTPTKIVNNLAVTPLCNVGDHLALWSPPSSEQLSLWTPATSEMMIPIAAAQQFVVVQYPNAVLRFSPNGSSVLDNTVAAAASVRMVATEFEIIGGTSSDSRPITRLSDGSSLTPVIHSSSITREKNASSGGPIFHSQVDYIHCLVPDLDKITKSSFYWGKIDRYEAERLLEGMPEGTFLLRDSAQEEYLFSVTFRKYGRSLHARIEQLNHKFSFDCHDPGVFTASTVTGLLEHYKDPSCVMFFEPMLTIPLHRTAAFSLQQLCRATIVSRTTYDGVSELELPSRIKAYLKEYHYKQRVRVKPLDESFYTMRS